MTTFRILVNNIDVATLGSVISAIATHTSDFAIETTPKATRKVPIKKGREPGGLTKAEKELLQAVPTEPTPNLDIVQKYANLGYNPSGTSAIVSRLVASGKLEKVRPGVYRRIA